MACQHCADHHHNHDEIEKEKKVENKNKKKIKLILYITSVMIFILGFFPIFQTYRMAVFFLCVILAGYDLLLEGLRNILHLDFGEDTLMAIAVVAAFILGEFPEACMVVLLFKLGEFLENKAVEMSNSNISKIAEIKANTANLLKADGSIEVVDVETIKVGDTIQIKPGEKVPVDCQIQKGTANLDTSSITGESKPLEAIEKMDILSGSININGNLICRVSKEFKDSTASQIVDLVYEAKNNKGETEKFITKFSKIYTPTVIVIALLLAIVPPLLGSFDFRTWIQRALVFLVASCPCSLVISVPLSFFSCVGAISKKGMLMKGTKHIESLAKANVIAFDKTGTLTTGKMVVDRIQLLEDKKEQEILSYLVSLEQNSNHPIATAIMEKSKGITKKEVTNYQEIPGYGIKAVVEQKEVLFGNRKLLEKEKVVIQQEEEGASYIAIDGKMIGFLTLKEEVRKESKDLIARLKKVGIQKVMMLTGDSKKAAEKINQQVGVDEINSNLLPQDKLAKIKQIKEQGKHVIFVGDGINDSPVLASADFGIAMGEGTEIAGSSSDGILISNHIGIIPEAISCAKASMRIIKFNIIFSLSVKAIVLLLGTIGIAPIWSAILADTGVTFLTVLNSIRIFRK